MEEAHRTHKYAAWGWFAALLALLNGFPRARIRSRTVRRPRADPTAHLSV